MIPVEIFWAVQDLVSSWQNVLDVLLVAAIFFAVFQLVRGSRAATLLRGIAVALILLWSLSLLLNLQAFSWLFSKALSALFIALPVIFQDELRRWFDRLGRVVPLRGQMAIPGSQRDVLITQICDAVRTMARRRHGALIVLERDTGLQEYIDSGVLLNASVTSELIQTIFFHNSPLHDGAVIIREGELMAAACTLPISTVRNMPERSMGLRHRASLGISEVSDAVAVIVSEENGRISVVVGGRFIRGIDPERLAMILSEYIRRGGPEGRLAMLWQQMRQGS